MEEGEITNNPGGSEVAPVVADVGERTDEEVIAAAARAVNEFLGAKPYAVDELLEAIGRRLGDPINDRTWGAVDATLVDYFGDRDAADVLAWALASDQGDGTRIEQLARNGSPELAEVARRITARYGVELRTADAMRDFPDNWRSLTHNVYRAGPLGRTFINLTIDKSNGDRFFLDGPADATMSLASFIMAALRLAGRDAFSENLLEGFVADGEDLFKQWREVDDLTGGDSGSPEAVG